VGVVADSHVGEFIDDLPSGTLEALAGCALILHAGDLSVPSVLDDLGAVAPVVAVRGDHDRLGGLALPSSAVVVVRGRRIGLIHGHRSPLTDASVVAASVVRGRPVRYRAALTRALRRRLGPVDAIVFGHWHEPVTALVAGTLLFSPGALCPWGSLEGGRPPRPGPAGVADRAVRRFRRQLGPAAMLPRVGILEVGAQGLRATSIPVGQ
jgi:uncharacterized protein